MEARHDIRLNKTFINAHNDIEWFESDVIHIERALNASPGSYKENPTSGVNIKLFQNSSGKEVEIARKIMLELQKDLYSCNNPSVKYESNGTLTINPNATLS